MRFVILAVTFALAPLTAQTTWLVDKNNSPGTHFTSISQAVNAAAPGDAILVAAASYSSVWIDKGIYLLGVNRPSITDLTIKNVPAGQHVVVKGFDCNGADATITDCIGSAHLEGMTVQRKWLAGQATAALVVQNSRHVSAADSSFLGSWFPDSFGGNVLIGGISVTNSGVHFLRCRMTGATATDPTIPIGAISAYSALAKASRLVFVDCTVRGARSVLTGGVPFFFEVAGSSGLVARNGSTIVARGTAFIPGGTGHTGVDLGSTDLLVRDPATPFPVVGGQTIDKGIHDLQTSGTPPGSTFSATLTAADATPRPFAVWASLPGPRPILHPESLWLDLTAPVQLFAGTVTGSRTDSGVIPGNFPLGLPITLQAVLLTSGQLELSTPTTLILY